MGYCIAGIGNDDSADCYCIYSFTEKDHGRCYCMGCKRFNNRGNLTKGLRRKTMKKMKKAAAELNFEAAAEYRDRLIMLKNTLRDID